MALARKARVRCYVDSAKNKLEILSVNKTMNESNYSSVQGGDSAFRR
ncbi:MAG TPA: hypothetical protein VKQ11_23395 [Candidatus Sulfotelmatobacter sp.]|nr:hypothetical protein [Candidatus Sulfotelmatobacter sp.]